MENELIKVKIVKADEHSWYKDKIGQIFEVKEFTEHFYTYKNRYGIAKSNCEVIKESEKPA